MKTKVVVLLVVVAFIAGYVISDYVAFHFSKAHGYKKRGGIFQHKEQ